MLGLPVYCDSNISTTVSTNQDVILVMKADDLVLWESGIRTRVYPVGGGTASTLTMRLELYGFTAFTAARYPASVCQITGAGLSTPTYN
ncbi:MAG: hypothetical protein AUG49_15690 [Catenulispora sp. 13_1_20CM_3_70_7]|nr:MAG: hypothetical protein AUG49_15690 [Catenulispora sp. 13_1_20CM_3_70_7]